MNVVYITNLMRKRHGFLGGAGGVRQDFIGIRPDIRRDLLYALGQYVHATSDNSMKPRTFSGNGSVRIMNLNTGKVCTRTPSQLTQLPMPQEWIEILALWANVSRKLRLTETHWEYRGHELSEEDPINMDLDIDLTKIVNLYNEGVRMPAPTQPVIPEPTPIEDDLAIAW